LERGFEVYRNISDHGSVDLIAYGENGQILRVEVTGGYRNMSTGALYYPPHPKHANRRDLIAVFDYTQERIIYFEQATGNEKQPDGHTDSETAEKVDQ
jgi:hypothetical protein